MLPVLITKLHIPCAHPNTVSRPQLIKRLEEGLWHAKGEDFLRRLTLVAAPAGYGKTTLLCEWIVHLQIPCAWITFDESDNNPSSFLQYLVASLQTIEPGLGETVLAVFQSPQFTTTQPSISDMMATLVNEIAAISRPFILVLDDYHTLGEQAIHQAVMFLLDHMPEKLCLVIATRADPPLLLSRLRARRQLVEVRSEDLRFSECEAAMFLRQVMHLDVQDQEVGVLTERTEGWIAGLQMAALALQGHGDIAGFVQDFSGRQRFVIDYLFEEVLRRQAEPTRTFLIQTSILDRMTGPLCDAVLGTQATEGPALSSSLAHGSGQQILEDLERANLFLVPLDGERHWYRYHHLFADLLRHRLHRTQPEREPELHRRAAAWYERNELMEEAVHHALKAQDYDLAVRLIQQVAFSLWRFSKNYTLLGWMRAMPEALVRSDADLSVHYAAALTVSGQLDAVEPWLQAAEARLQEQPDSPIVRASLGHVYRLRAYVARFVGTPVEALVFSHRALEYTPADRVDMRGVTLLHIGHAHLLNGDTTAADQALVDACDICRAVGHPAAYLSAAHYLAQLRIYQGRLRETQMIYRAAAEFVADQGESVCAGIEQIGLGDLLREWNDLEAAAQHIHVGLKLAEIGGDFVFLRDGYLARARLEQALGNLDEALAFVHKAEQVVQHHRCPWEMALVGLWEARLCLARRDRAGAAAWAETCGLSPDDEPRFLDEFGHLTLAQVLLDLGRPNEAGRLLERLRQAAESAGRQGRLIHILIAQALVQQASGDEAGALIRLESSLVLAEPEGYVRTFVDEGEPVRSLLARYRAQLTQRSKGVDPADIRALAYVDKLLSAFPSLASEKQAPSATSLAPSVLVDPLTARELEVLRLIAAGLSNKEIADRLVVTVGTVKAHSSSIYRKLDVPGRTRAVAMAREIHII